MVVGKAERAAYASMEEFAEEISGLRPHEAIALGSLRGDLPDEVKVVTKRKLEELNGTANNLIARTSDHILYRIGQPALALIDVDTKGMPDAVRDKIKALGGFWECAGQRAARTGAHGARGSLLDQHRHIERSHRREAAGIAC